MSTRTLGDKLKELRQTRKLSMRALAEKTGLKSPAFIADVERGYRQPSSEALGIWATALEVPLDELLAFDRRPPVRELKNMIAKNSAWAPALRRLAAEGLSGRVTPATLQQFLNQEPQKPGLQKDFDLGI